MGAWADGRSGRPADSDIGLLFSGMIAAGTGLWPWDPLDQQRDDGCWGLVLWSRQYAAVFVCALPAAQELSGQDFPIIQVERMGVKSCIATFVERCFRRGMPQKEP